jgi:hypothetical protein
MGSLALRPGDSLAILVDGFVNRLQDSQFPSFLLFKLRGLDSYPGGTFTHCSCQPSLDAHFSVLIYCGSSSSANRQRAKGPMRARGPGSSRLRKSNPDRALCRTKQP